MQMVRQDHNGLYNEGVPLPNRSYHLAQGIHMLNQQPAPPLSQVYREEISRAGGIRAAIAHRASLR